MNRKRINVSVHIFVCFSCSRKVAGGSLLPSSICHALGTSVERIKKKHLTMVQQRPWLKCRKIPVTTPVTKIVFYFSFIFILNYLNTKSLQL